MPTVPAQSPVPPSVKGGGPASRRRPLSAGYRRAAGGALLLLAMVVLGAALSGCRPQDAASASGPSSPAEAAAAEQPPAVEAGVTPLPTRPTFAPGELVEYTAQTGDTLPALAVRFNTPVEEILEANPVIPDSATTLPPGLPMQIPIYYLPFWGSPYQILPDSLFVNGPAQVGFDTAAFVDSQPGWLRGHVEYAAGDNRTGAQVVDIIALNFSVSPRLLLALLEHQSGALSDPAPEAIVRSYALGNRQRAYRGLYLQLVYAANLLNDAYYRYRQGMLTDLELLDGTVERPDPWQNAASAALQAYFSQLYEPQEYAVAVGPEGIAQTYARLFGDPWANDQPHIPGSLAQPAFTLPFEPGKTWALTGGPHTAWGEGEPMSALDFAPPAVVGGCQPSSQWATAVAPGLVVRSELGTVVLDLDSDGDERTGWVVFYFHVATEGRANVGASLAAGQPVGHPSCEGGRATGTHVHIARKYNGEWIPAAGVLAYNLEGWISQAGAQPYQGTLTRFTETVTACDCSDSRSHIEAREP